MVNNLASAYTNYLNTLENTGYINDTKVTSLLVYDFIVDLLFKKYPICISDEEYSTFIKALNCLQLDNCLIPYTNYVELMGKYIERNNNKIQICDDSSSNNSDDRRPLIVIVNENTIKDEVNNDITE